MFFMLMLFIEALDKLFQLLEEWFLLPFWQEIQDFCNLIIYVNLERIKKKCNFKFLTIRPNVYECLSKRKCIFLNEQGNLHGFYLNTVIFYLLNLDLMLFACFWVIWDLRRASILNRRVIFCKFELWSLWNWK